MIHFKVARVFCLVWQFYLNVIEINTNKRNQQKVRECLA